MASMVVNTPTTLWLSTTMAEPIFFSAISATTSSRLASGLTVYGSVVIASSTVTFWGSTSLRVSMR